jgi:predicted O-linked N-acetylglucosamine transferase (SPINDLY family)
VQPDSLAAASADALLRQAMEHHQAGQLPQAEALYRQVLALAPGHVDALYLLGVMACQCGQYSVALKLLDQAILGRPDLAQLHAKRGDTLYGLGRYQAAVDSFDRALRLQPNSPDACNNRGVALHALGEFQAAIEVLDIALRLQPDFPEAYVNRGLALDALRQYPAALESYDHAIRLQPGFAQAHFNRGNTLHALGRFQEAVASYDQAIALDPGLALAHNNRGLSLHQLRRFQDSIAAFDRALELRPDLAEAHSNRGSALFELGRYRDALAAFDSSLHLQPAYADAHSNRGSALNSLGRYTEALQSLEEAIRLQPDLAPAWSGRGVALQGLGLDTLALESCDQALRLDPACAEAYANRGALLLGLERYPEALASFDQALALNPKLPFVRGMRLQMCRSLCRWDGLEEETRALEARIERGEKATVPFPLLGLSDSPVVQRRAAEIYARDKFPAPATLPAFPPRSPGRKIRIGYYSADFHSHAICNLMVELFERSDRTRFELFAFSFGPTHDPMTKRVAAAMDQFLEVQSLSDAAIAQRSRELEIDIAVDLMGFTLHCRTGIFVHRAAPIQVNYLGYPATMGCAAIDYLIADAILIPESGRPYYSEKIVTLPDTFQATNSTLAPDSVPCTRAGEGLPEHGFVFCCFNNSAKIGPAMFDLWMRILDRVPDSVLWLLQENPGAAESLRQQAQQSGIDPGRLVFAGRVPLGQHLSRQRLAGLFLDTFPFNAGATASPALWAGLPVLTRMGQTFAGRMAASLLRAMSLPESSLDELIATSEQEYQARAIELALDPERLRDLRERLEANRRTTPLFDTAAFTRHLEAAYTAMVARLQSNLPPDHIHIARSAGQPTSAL